MEPTIVAAVMVCINIAAAGYGISTALHRIAEAIEKALRQDEAA